MPKTIQVSLRGVELLENGEIGKTPTAVLLSFRLAYPNATIAERITVKALKLGDNATVDFLTDVSPDTDKPYTYADRVLFKEMILGETELSLSVAAVNKTSKLDKFLASLFGAVFSAAWKLAVGGIVNVLLGAAVEAAGSAHVKSFEVGDDKSVPLGDSSVQILEAAVVPKTVRLELTAYEDVTIERWEMQEGKARKVKRTILKKGDSNGSVDVDVVVL